MASQVQQFACTVPIGTPISAPVTIEMQLGVFTVDWVDIDVPPGPSGALGFYLASSNVQIIPFTEGGTFNWMIPDDLHKQWDLTGYPTSGDWQFVGYNLGAFAHTVYLAFGVDPVNTPSSSPVILSSEVLSS